MNEPRVLIVIPTFNESENLERAVAAVHSALPAANVLVVDDDSPDGTGALADRLAAEDDRITVLHRERKGGLGAAYLAGFSWGLGRGYDIVGEFDADGSHPASTLPRMVRVLEQGCDLVIGSRWVSGGSVVDWPRSREILSRGGNAYARLLLRLPIHDATGGFRLFRAEMLRSLDLDSVESKGYCFQVDLTLRTHDRGGRIAEVPIEFRERELGTSKMSRAIVVEAMLKVTIWALRRRLGPAGPRVRDADLAAEGPDRFGRLDGEVRAPFDRDGGRPALIPPARPSRRRAAA